MRAQVKYDRFVLSRYIATKMKRKLFTDDGIPIIFAEAKWGSVNGTFAFNSLFSVLLNEKRLI